nr:hypothetical protein [Pandoravirus belohorizontensis]
MSDSFFFLVGLFSWSYLFVFVVLGPLQFARGQRQNCVCAGAGRLDFFHACSIVVTKKAANEPKHTSTYLFKDNTFLPFLFIFRGHLAPWGGGLSVTRVDRVPLSA